MSLPRILRMRMGFQFRAQRGKAMCTHPAGRGAGMMPQPAQTGKVLVHQGLFDPAQIMRAGIEEPEQEVVHPVRIIFQQFSQHR